MKKAFCEPGKVENNGVLAFAKYVLFPLLTQGEGTEWIFVQSFSFSLVNVLIGFLIQRGADNGGDIEYATYEQMENDFSQSLLHPGDLKAAVEMRLNALLEPVRQIFQAPELVKLVKEAYPPPAKVKANVAAADDVVAPHRLDMRVGKIVQVERHPEADSLYVEKIDLGTTWCQPCYAEWHDNLILTTQQASPQDHVQLWVALWILYLNRRCWIEWW